MRSREYSESVVRVIECKTHRKYYVEEKIRIVQERLRGEESLAELGDMPGASGSSQ